MMDEDYGVSAHHKEDERIIPQWVMESVSA